MSESPRPPNLWDRDRDGLAAFFRHFARNEAPQLDSALYEAFCDGVADDAELDRISDLELFGNRFAALGPGQPIAVAWMKGRSRPFTIGAQRGGRSALSVGFNDRCDAFVATAVTALDHPAAIEKAVLELLNSRTVLRWAEVTLGR